jgi:hypothetical protein
VFKLTLSTNSNCWNCLDSYSLAYQHLARDPDPNSMKLPAFGHARSFQFCFLWDLQTYILVELYYGLNWLSLSCAVPVMLPLKAHLEIGKCTQKWMWRKAVHGANTWRVCQRICGNAMEIKRWDAFRCRTKDTCGSCVPTM